jgi:hypothetical protein
MYVCECVFILTNNLEAIRNLTQNDKLSRRHFLLNCRQVIWIVISTVQHYTGGDVQIPEDDLKKKTTEVGDRTTAFPLEHPRIKPTSS